MKHSEVRQKIVETASYLFYHNGYNLTGINEIISEAGIAKATLYNHFKSKEDICLAYLEFRHSTFIRDIEAFATKAQKGKDQILAIFGFLDAFFKDRDFNGCWCVNTVSEIPKENQRIRHEIQQQKNELIQLIRKLILINLDDQNEEQSELLAKKLYLLYEGAVAESHMLQDNWPIGAAKDIAQKML